MSGDAHVRICESLGVKFPRATRLAVVTGGRQSWLWRAVDDEGEVLDLLVQRRRDKAAAVKLMRKLLKKQGFAPKLVITDKLRSYAAAFRSAAPFRRRCRDLARPAVPRRRGSSG